MSNEGNIKTSILLILLKYIVLGYSNGKKSFAGTLFLNYGLLNMPSQFFFFFFFFDISFIVFFTRLLSNGLWRNYPFSAEISKFQKSISKYSILQKIRMSNFVHLSIFGAVFSEIKNADILNFSWIKYFGNDFSFLIK